MKFNKLTIGLGAMALLMTGCYSNEDQTYVPAEGVNVPAAYFPVDYNGDVVIDENQTSFQVPVYRSTTDGTQTANVTVKVNGDFFKFVIPPYSADDQKLADLKPAGEGEYTATFPVEFADGENLKNVTVVYDWATMAENAGKEFEFNFTVDGESSSYFSTSADCVAIYVPWEPLVGPKGETSGTFIDEVIYTVWNVDEPFVYEVEIQSNPLASGLYRVMTPYANCPTNPAGSTQLIYTGGDKVNIMYINATDPENVYLCNKSGKADAIYDTYYTIDVKYGNVTLFDRASGSISGQATSKPNAGFAPGYFTTHEVAGAEYPNSIVFPEDHFYVLFGNYVESGNQLQILFPGGEGEKEWNELGMASFTDAMITVANDLDAMEWEVPIEQNIENEGIYRLVNPYTNYWPEDNPQDDDYDIRIDCSTPELVIVKAQDTGNWITVGRADFYAYIVNAGAFYQYNVKDEYILTPEQIIAEGLNDTFENGEINLRNAMALMVTEEGQIYDLFDCAEEGTDGVQIVLPTPASESHIYAHAAAKNAPKGITYRKRIKSHNGVIKAVPLFDLAPVRRH